MQQAKRACPTPGCPEFQPCPNHRYDPDHSRRAHQRYGGKTYQRNRRRALQQAGNRCQLCGGQPVQVHHRRKIADGGTHDLANLIVVCRTHHEQLERMGAYEQLVRDDGPALHWTGRTV